MCVTSVLELLTSSLLASTAGVCSAERCHIGQFWAVSSASVSVRLWDSSVQSWAVWYEDVLVVFYSPPEEAQSESSEDLYCHLHGSKFYGLAWPDQTRPGLAGWWTGPVHFVLAFFWPGPLRSIIIFFVAEKHDIVTTSDWPVASTDLPPIVLPNAAQCNRLY